MTVNDITKTMADEAVYREVFADDYSGASWFECRDCAACDGAHTDDCPFRDWPKIVAVLEAAERVLAYLDEEGCVDRCADYVRGELGAALRGETAG